MSIRLQVVLIALGFVLVGFDPGLASQPAPPAIATETISGGGLSKPVGIVYRPQRVNISRLNHAAYVLSSLFFAHRLPAIALRFNYRSEG